jgi:alkylation response protein AidB-like acyl-CoA dehydrogenase
VTNPLPIILAVAAPVLGYRWGRRRRAEGSPVSPHEALRFALAVWAVGLPAATLPAVLGSPNNPIVDRAIVTSIVLAAAAAPLAVDRLITWALRLVRRREAGA